jgi:organic hydroperoxide reductase OsmC/OhrA
MSEHKATIAWKNNSGDFRSGRFSREHTWAFDGGITVTASASPSVVRPPMSNPAAIDPEEAFVASVSSCHMLTFVYLAWKAGFEPASYEDHAVGHMSPNENKVPWISRVVLSPRVAYRGERRPTPDDEAHLHHEAHAQCFIAQSVKTAVEVVPPASDQ